MDLLAQSSGTEDLSDGDEDYAGPNNTTAHESEPSSSDSEEPDVEPPRKAARTLSPYQKAR